LGFRAPPKFSLKYSIMWIGLGNHEIPCLALCGEVL
jgi:hypothetical protein